MTPGNDVPHDEGGGLVVLKRGARVGLILRSWTRWPDTDRCVEANRADWCCSRDRLLTLRRAPLPISPHVEA
jgi:hypothetical protein